MSPTMRTRHMQSEKPKGKRRKLRDYAEKLARVAREEARTAEIVSQHPASTKKLVSGQCESMSCGAEAACLPYNNYTYYCLCTDNGEPPNEDFKCPRSTVPLTPKPIHNIILPTRTTNTSTDRFSAAPTQQMPNSFVSGDITAEATAGSESGSMIGAGSVVGANAGALAAAAAVGGAVLVLLLASLAFCYMRRRICLVAGKTQPRVRPNEPLLPDRYITNPQYGVCSAGAPPGVQIQAAAPGGNPESAGENQVPLLDRSALTFLEEVGEGCFGKVHKGLLRVASGEQVVAVKVLKDSAGRSAEEDFKREVSIMSAFRHTNILSLIGVVYRDDISGSPWMVFEYMEFGDLAGVLRGSRGGGFGGKHARFGVSGGPVLDEPALLHVALQVARGMQYLAARRFVHRDLAARNCLVGANLAVKIADFGMSRDVYTSDYYKMGGERPMPVRWMSPESIVYARFTHESDVWSYGVVIWEIYSRGKQPFYGHNNDGATKLILQGIVLVPPEDCPRFACELMRCCWRSDPQDRIGFDEICKKLEIASEAVDASISQPRLPRPPASLQDSAGYLIPATFPVSEYFSPLPDPDDDEHSSEDDDEDST